MHEHNVEFFGILCHFEAQKASILTIWAATGCFILKVDTSNGRGSVPKHFWPHNVKAKMCLRTGSFIFSTGVFCVHEVYTIRKWVQFSTCFCGLVDRTLGWYAKGPRFKTHLGLTRKSYFYRNFVIFSTFLQNEFLSNETATSQTNFSLYNLGSQMHGFKVIAVYISKTSFSQ